METWRSHRVTSQDTQEEEWGFYKASEVYEIEKNE